MKLILFTAALILDFFMSVILYSGYKLKSKTVFILFVIVNASIFLAIIFMILTTEV